MSFVTFIIPTLNRPTLVRSLESLLKQTDPDWNAVVECDGVDEFSIPVKDDRIAYVHIPVARSPIGNGGYTRNSAMRFCSGKWTAFLDDDDTVDSKYVEWLKAESEEFDLIVFRMRFAEGLVLPPGQELIGGQVGISFAIRREFHISNSLSFKDQVAEDWDMICQCLGAKARWKISDNIAYYVRH